MIQFHSYTFPFCIALFQENCGPLTHLSHRRFALSTLSALLLTPALAKGGPGANKKDIPTEVSFDIHHTDIAGNPTLVDGLPLPNGITDDGGTYSKSNTVSTGVGRNRNVWLIFANAGRSLNIDLGNPLGCAGSVAVDLVQDAFDGNDWTILNANPDGVCDHCYFQDPLRPQLPLGTFVATDPTFTIAMGEDLDELLVGCEVETNARLDFTDSDGNEWRLTWGPRQRPGADVPNPRSNPIRLLRTNQGNGNLWIFQTTGNHPAALYRRHATQAGNYYEYHGQFTIPYSGVAEALSYDPNLTGNHCNLQIASQGSALLPSEVSLSHDATSNTLTATATDHCDDFSACPGCFDWYVDGAPVAPNSNNTFELTPHPSANTITVYAAHPDWLAMLPDLQTITRADIEGSASFSQGTGGGDQMTLNPLAWSFPRGGKDVKVTITVVESATGDPLAGITVTGSLVGPGASFSINATTNSNGQVSVREKNVNDGLWCVTDLDVQDPGGTYTWDNDQPSPNCETK